MMQWNEFFERFTEDQAIGRDLTENHLLVFYDNESHVGVWRHERRSTEGSGEVLGAEDAARVRAWFLRPELQCVQAETHRKKVEAWRTPATG
jgi:hypothetical protein